MINPALQGHFFSPVEQQFCDTNRMTQLFCSFSFQGYAVMAESQKLRPGYSTGLAPSPQLPSSGYQNIFEDRARALISSHTQDNDSLQKLNNRECTPSLKNSLSEVSACEKQGLCVPLKRQNYLKNKEDKYITAQSFTER